MYRLATSQPPRRRCARRDLVVAVAVLATWLLAAGAAVALESDRQQPIELAADSVDIDEGRGISVYKGDVDLRQGSIRLRADTVTVHQKGKKPSRIVAEGRPVKFQQQSRRGPVKGEARRVEYEVDSENLVLNGDAVLVQGQDSMRSDRIVYDRVRSVVKAGAAADGKQRVRISIEAPGD
ncbi:MAG: lipopolysaccharide transport periplasmic protein LptA [Gammaproteobacteria bacterium]|nr:lipopolysaccharide transport periplasmic protein LptA [Gammaproteobacteria bacterium]